MGMAEIIIALLNYLTNVVREILLTQMFAKRFVEMDLIISITTVMMAIIILGMDVVYSVSQK